MRDTDFLIIGSGLAGLNAAMRLAQHGTVAVVTKRDLQDGATSWAQGGIASVMGEHDSFDNHVRDTLEAGAGLCREDAVRSIVEDGPQAIERLIELGVVFDRYGEGFDLTKEGGHSKRRILHSQDITGREISRALHSRAHATDAVTLYPEHIAVDLLTTQRAGLSGKDRCHGAYVLNSVTGEVQTFRAKATLVAAGGAGKVYLYTSNPDVATGDGVAMAFRAGATIANMEFFQFHPTCLFHPRAKSFLISEALRGEGGVLRMADGQPLMRGIHPLGDLAPRDIVARAIDRAMKRTGEEHANLDMTGASPAYVTERFPNIHQACMALGIDMTRVPIPVVPAAHYCCGGIKTDVRGATDLPGLWAAGEAGSTGLHGANRLASNSLLEAAVVSERAAEDMAQFAKSAEPAVGIREWDSGDASDPDEMVVVSHNWDELRRTMWNYVGIVRSDKRLERAMHRLELLQEEIQDYYWDFKLTHDLIELRNLATVARLIIESARYRRESRGLHYNIDCPDSSQLARDTLVRRESKGLALEAA
ncbi:MAG: L-aspartate oxidase [Myxococcota bacterium]